MKLNEKILEELKKCKSNKDILDVVKKNNIELSEEDLKAVSGGNINDILKKIYNSSENKDAIYGLNLDSLGEDNDNLGNPS